MKRFTISAATAAALFLATAASVWAAPIPLGAFAGAFVTFETVVADDGAPGATIDWGTPGLSGAQLDFDPLAFSVAASGGTSEVVAPITFTLIAAPGVAITSLSAFQSGALTLAGSGSAATQALAAGLLSITLEEVDGIAVAPLVLIPVNGSVGFNLLSAVERGQPWSLGLSTSIETQLGLNAIPFTLGATRVSVTFTPSLSATNEPNSSAVIDLTDLKFEASTVGSPTGEVPEPAAAGLMAAGLALLLAARKRLSQHGATNSSQ